MEGYINKKAFNQNLAGFDFTTDESDYEYECDYYNEEEQYVEDYCEEEPYAYEDWLDYRAYTEDRYFIDEYDYDEYINDSKEILRYLKEKESAKEQEN